MNTPLTGAALHHGQPNETCLDCDRRAEMAEARYDALADRVRALAEVGETDGRGNSLDLARRLRALLDEAES